MAMPNPEDPFLTAQSEILLALKQTRSLHSSYLRIRSLASSPTSPELSQARQELETALSELATDLQDLVDSVRAVEGDPFRYGLDVEEIGRRRQLVKSVGDEVEGMREELKSNVATGKGKGKGAMNRSTLPPPGVFDTLDSVPNGGDGDDYGAYEQQRQVEMMHEQDEQLDGVFKSVGNLRAQADTMGRELEEQVGMVDDMDNIADRVGGKLQNGIKRVGWVIRNNEGRFACQGRQILADDGSLDYRYLVKLLHRYLNTRADYAAGTSSGLLSGKTDFARFRSLIFFLGFVYLTCKPAELAALPAYLV